MADDPRSLVAGLPEWYRTRAQLWRQEDPVLVASFEALADVVDGVLARHGLFFEDGRARNCRYCGHAWPCEDLLSLMPIAGALGVRSS